MSRLKKQITVTVDCASEQQMSRLKKQITVTVDCASELDAATAAQILSRYEFKVEGLVKLDEKIRKKDFLVTKATQSFIALKS